MRNGIIPVTVVILTKNEDSNVKDLIPSLNNFNQVIVFDSNSTDLTVPYSKELDASIEFFTWDGKYPKKKQTALELSIVENEWILLLDADERVTKSLSEEIHLFVSNPKHNFVAGEFSIEYYFAKQKLKFGYRPKKISLIRKSRVRFPEVDDLDIPSAWEVEGHYQPNLDGDLYTFNNRLIHNDNDPIQDWMIRHIRYAQWDSASRMSESGNIPSKSGLIKSFFSTTRFRAPIIFLYSYVMRLGFLDGRMGFDYAFALSWFYWLSDLISRETIKSNES
jgi:glycosyltransferase involved in cell wall biosynthesis